MNQNKKLYSGLIHFINTVYRFPLTVLLLILIAVVNGLEIQHHFTQYSKLLFTFITGVLLSLVAQVVYERFFDKFVMKVSLMAGTVVLTAGYYFTLPSVEKMNTIFTIRTSVMWFILLIAFLWIPTIQEAFTFNENILAVFTAFFLAVFYSGVMFIGVSLVIMAIDKLIVPVDSNSIPHAANLIFCVFAAIHLLSNLPAPLNRIENEGEIGKETERKVTISKLLETLISYVVIPITAIFTLVLLLYVIMNITGSFWTNNLMEPLLVSYSITVIVVYLLSSNIANKLADMFRKVFPKVLVPIVLFQTIASVLKIGEMGVTHGRYYAILFGIFSTIAGILFCFVPKEKNGLIAPILILLSLVSIVPPIDAFTLSRKNQVDRLKEVLIRNDMLQDDKITPSNALSQKDKEIIKSAVNYLDRYDYTEEIPWLLSYADQRDFDKTFGFPRYEHVNKDDTIFLSREHSAVPISGYDILLKVNLYYGKEDREIESFSYQGKQYRLLNQMQSNGEHSIVLVDGEDKEIIRLDMQEIESRSISLDNGLKDTITLEEATFTKESDHAKMTIVAEYINMFHNYESTTDEKHLDMEAYVMIALY